MPPVAVTREQARAIDRLAIETLGIAGLVLMENAGRSAAAVILDLLRKSADAAPNEVVILCGGGNNGGDGYVVARHLHNAGVPVRIYAAVHPANLKGDALINATIAEKMRLPLIPIDAQLGDTTAAWYAARLIVDALLGTGFSGEVRPHIAAIIEACNRARAAGVPVVALDLPSGIDTDTGQPANACVRADVTVTFAAEKTGFRNPASAAYTGRVVIGDIGVPPELVARAAAPLP